MTRSYGGGQIRWLGERAGGDRGADRAAGRPPVDVGLRARPARARRVLVPAGAARRGRVPALDRGGRRDRAHLRRARRAGGRVRHRLLARGPRARGRGRRRGRHEPDGRDPAREHRGPRRHGPARRHPHGAREAGRRRGRVLQRRPGSRRVARRDGGHRRLGDQHRPLRDDARQRARARGRAGRRARDPHRHAGAQVERRLRPHAPVRRLGGDARDHHRAHAAAAADPGGDLGRGVLVPDHRRRRRHRDRHRPVRRADRPLRAARRDDDGGGQRPRRARAPRGADAVPRVPRLAQRRRGGRPLRRGARARAGRRRLRMGHAQRGPVAAVARPPQRLLRRHRAAARLPRRDDRRVRAGVRARGHDRRHDRRPRRSPLPRPAARPRRRRELPRDAAGRPRRSRATAGRPRPSTSGWSSARSPPAGRAPASTASASASAARSGEQSGEAVEVMRALKAALDPGDLLNPGKVLPTPPRV